MKEHEAGNTLQWDNSKENDPVFLKEYYQSRADLWKATGTKEGRKIAKRFMLAVKSIKP